MTSGARVGVAVGVLVLLGGLAALGWWYQRSQQVSGRSADTLTVNVTSGADRGPGTLREALFLAAAAKGKAEVVIKVKEIAVETALPPLVNTYGVRVIGPAGGVALDAHALGGAAVLDVAGANTSLENLQVRNCSGTAVLLRATDFRLRTSRIEACDVGVDVAENAGALLLERDSFVNDRIGVRFAASTPNAVLSGNEFSNDKDAGLWAVRAAPDAHGSAITVRENRFNNDRSGIVAANVAVLIERNQFSADPEAAIHLLGAGATLHANQVSGGSGMGIIAENARDSIIDGNELAQLAAYGVMVRNSAGVLVRNNRVHNCGYGLAFVLGDQRSPSTAVDNTIIEPQFNGIDVIGDSPILRRNQVLQPRAFALHVVDFHRPDGTTVTSHPFLDGNNFRAADTTQMAAGGSSAVKQP
jgi:Right handed beta helix region